MDIPITEQLIQAASSLVLGIAAGFLYDLFRVVRRRARSKTVTAVTDFLFWLITGIALFLLGLSLGEGRQRIFMNVIAVLGCILYFCTLSRLSLIAANAIADAVVFLFWCLSRPFVWAYMAVKKIRYFLKNIFHYALKWYKISADNKFQAEKGVYEAKAHTKGVTNEAEKGRYNYEDRHIRSDRVRVGDSDQHALPYRRRAHKTGRAETAGGGETVVKRPAPVRNRSQRG
jgi:spore cortex biosynthesis protein YabQ